jgi:hypothetical protein
MGMLTGIFLELRLIACHGEIPAVKLAEYAVLLGGSHESEAQPMLQLCVRHHT